MAGIIALFGSGETSKQGRQAHEILLERLPRPPKVAILETPAGFQPNIDSVSDKLRAFFEHNLQNYRPEVEIVPAREQAGPHSVDAPEVVDGIARADLIFAGPGSPTYAARVLAGSRAFDAIVARALDGATLSLASAAAIACGRYALPVYEIFKVGDELRWAPGLDLFAHYGLNLTVIPHWNNHEGGADLDTSRCYMGAERFARLLDLLPGPTTILAIDEHTACILDPDAGTATVHGAGSAYVLRDGAPTIINKGQTLDLAQLQAPLPRGAHA